MPPTVKSLEERIDDLADEVGGLKTQMAVVASGLGAVQSQVATLTSGLNTVTTQLAIVVAKLETATAEMARTNARLDATNVRLETLATEFANFRGRAEATFGLAKWVGAFAATVLVGVIASAFSVTRAAGNLETRVEAQQKMLDQQQKILEEIRAKQK